MSFFTYLRDFRDFWFALAVWAATKCFCIVHIYSRDDVVVGLTWTSDDDFAQYVRDYQADTPEP